MSEETDVDAGMMTTGVKQMEEGKVESSESGGSPKSPKKLIIDEEIQEREKKLVGLVVHQGEAFHH